MSAMCKVCEDMKLSETSLPFGVCEPCRNQLGIVPMPPPRRRTMPCRTCNAMKFVRVIPRVLSSSGGESSQDRAAPMTATHGFGIARPMFSDNLIWPNITGGVGMLEVYICTSCGAVEWYCQDPERIPIGQEYMSDVVDYEAAPYR